MTAREARAILRNRFAHPDEREHARLWLRQRTLFPGDRRFVLGDQPPPLRVVVHPDQDHTRQRMQAARDWLRRCGLAV